MNELIKVANQNGKLVVSSREVARNFDKRHDNVLRDIEYFKKDILNFEEMFFETELPDSYGREQKIYLMNRDGFSLLTMGFTGQKALQWKLKYIEAFNRMEESLKQTIPNVSQTELIAMMAQNSVEIERKADRALESSERTEKRLDNALDVFASPPDKDWRDSMNKRMRGMCEQYRLNYPVFYRDLYQELEALARVDIQTRLTRLRKRMLANGATKTACKNVTKLEIVASDPKLRPIFEGIVRKYQAKYALDWSEERA